MWVGAYLVGGLLCAATASAIPQDPETEPEPTGHRKFGDKCSSSQECGFRGSHCNKGVCTCRPEFPATNHFDKCGVEVDINGTCTFNEQCEMRLRQTECRDNRCVCRFELKAVLNQNNQFECIVPEPTGPGRFGDRCTAQEECGFIGGHCDNGVCTCRPGYSATNHFDKCGVEVDINGTCFFNEQCEARVHQTDCRDNRCSCKFEMKPIINKNNQVECIADNVPWEPERYVDPTMIGVLVGMALMFVIICVVLRLFSKARWRENRTIFNTPNPRLMNVSLLRDTKPASGERRGSRGSNTKPPSRQPSLASLRPTSPAQSHGQYRRSLLHQSSLPNIV